MVRGEEVYRRRRLLETVYIEESVSECRRRDRFFFSLPDTVSARTD